MQRGVSCVLIADDAEEMTGDAARFDSRRSDTLDTENKNTPAENSTSSR